MGAVHHLEEFDEEAPPLPMSATRRTRRFSGRVRLSDSYSPGGERLHVDRTVGLLRTVSVTPEFDGERFVVWDSNRRDPHLRVLVPGRGEEEEGADLSTVTRDVELTFLK